jgi:hypothetical protein
MKPFFISSNHYKVLQKAISEGSKALQGTILRQNGKSSSLKNVLVSKFNQYQSSANSLTLQQDGLLILCKEQEDTALCCEEAATILQYSQIQWHIVACKNQKENDSRPPILQGLKMRSIIKAARKSKLIRSNWIAHLILNVCAMFVIAVLCAMVFIPEFYSPSFSFNWAELIRNYSNYNYPAVTIVSSCMGIWLLNLLIAFIETRRKSLIIKIYNNVQNLSPSKKPSDKINYFKELVLRIGMPLAVICQDYAKLDNFSKMVIESILTINTHNVGRILWIVFCTTPTLTNKDNSRKEDIVPNVVLMDTCQQFYLSNAPLINVGLANSMAANLKSVTG